MEHYATSRILDEELESFIADRLPGDTATVVKIKIQSKADESMIIAQQIVLFVKWLGYEVSFDIGESLFVPAGAPEMEKVQLIDRSGSPEIYIKNIR